MKSNIFPLFLTISVLVSSCATQLSDHRMVSDAWLDTSPRKPQLPARSSDGISHWNAGLPSARAVSLAQKQSAAARSARTSAAESQVHFAKQDSYYQPSGYVTGYRSRYIGRRGSSRYGQYQSQNQPYERTVEKVGPPIVPRMNVPLIDRSSGFSSTANYRHQAGPRYGGSYRHGNSGQTTLSKSGRGRNGSAGRHR